MTVEEKLAKAESRIKALEKVLKESFYAADLAYMWGGARRREDSTYKEIKKIADEYKSWEKEARAVLEGTDQ
jgi:hypothetical protein